MNPSIRHPTVFLATWFGTGFMPKAPGTWGSLAALPFAWLILAYSGPLALIIASIIVCVIGIWAAEGYMRLTGAHDPGAVVIDEVAGQWLVLAVVPLEWWWFVLGFAVFRVFDILKPWPISWMDKHIKGGLGVMLDDMAAGIAGAAVLYGAQWALEVL